MTNKIATRQDASFIVRKDAIHFAGPLPAGKCVMALRFAFLLPSTNIGGQVKKPLVNYNGTIKEIAPTDSLFTSPTSIDGMWDIDGDGNLTPSSIVRSDNYWTVDGNGDVVTI